MNAHEAKEVRKKILTSMKGVHALEFTFKKNMLIVTRSSSCLYESTMIAQADPQLLFQRLIMVAGRMTENVGRYFPV